MNKKELEEIIDFHNNNSQLTNFKYVDLIGADLHRANLSGVNLHGAILRGADLSCANLSDSNLCGADLRKANLSGSSFAYANLHRANFRGANLRGANFHGANLYGALLCDADLYAADFSDVNFYGANLRGAKFNDDQIFIPLACPRKGSFIGWKKVKIDSGILNRELIVKLEIPSDAKRVSATTEKCRCDKAKVLAIEDIIGIDTGLAEIVNNNYAKTIYKVGEMVYPDKFDEDRWNECSNGIHFFVDRRNAVRYDL